jgi:hypothetical protein
MSRNKQTLFSVTREMLRQFVSCLGGDGDLHSTNKKSNDKGAYMSPEAYDIRMNGDGRKSLQSVQAPR